MKYQIKAAPATVNKTDGDSAEIHVNDFIGDWLDYYWGMGVTSRQFIEDLQRLPDNVKTVRLFISSPGGDVIAANHIANVISDQQARGRTFESLVTAAFSAATIITSATKQTKIADNGMMMINDPWAFVVGNARELRKAADASDKFRDSIVAVYLRKSTLSEKKIIDMMAEETYMDADDAIKNGFADEKIGSIVVNASFDVSLAAKLPNVPEQFRARVQSIFGVKDKPAPTPDDARRESREIVDLCAKAGVADAALSFLDKGLTVDEVKTRLADAEAIRTACVLAKLPNRAANYVKAGMTIAEVRAELFDIMANNDPKIDNTLPVNDKPRPPAVVINANEIFEARRNWKPKK